MPSPTVSPTRSMFEYGTLSDRNDASEERPRAQARPQGASQSGPIATLAGKKRSPSSTPPAGESDSASRKRQSSMSSPARAAVSPTRRGRFAKKHEAEASPVDQARAEIARDLDFATLCAALHTGLPAKIQAVLSLIADGTVKPEHFFHDESAPTERDRSIIDDLLALYNKNSRRPDLSRFIEGWGQKAQSDVERLSSDMACFRALLAACQDERAHPDIKDAATRYDYILAAACTFIHRAAPLTEKLRADPINLVEPMLCELLDRLSQRVRIAQSALEGGGEDIQDLSEALCDILTESLHPDTRQIFHRYGVEFAAHLACSPTKIDCALALVSKASLVPKEQQRDAFKTAVNLIAESSRAAFNDDNEQHDSLIDCAYLLAELHDDVMGKAAVDLIDAANIGQNVSLELLETIYERAVSSVNPRTGEMRFASLPEADRERLFLAMLDGHRLDPEGDLEWCRSMLSHLPQGAQAAATEMLRRAESGDAPDLV